MPVEQISKRLMNWATVLEPATRAQAERTASMPFIYPHLALMPDAHLGKGATVGSVIPTLGAIIPAAVGVDIGCGMIAVRTQFTADDISHRGDPARLRESIENAIPLSAGKYNTEVYDDATAARISELRERDGSASAEAIARTGTCSSARSAQAITSSRSAFTKRIASGCSCTRARAVLVASWP